MIPAYALIVFTFLATARVIIQGSDPQGKPSTRGRKALTIIGTVLGLIMLIFAAALPILFPRYRMQKPTEAQAGETRIRPVDGMVMLYIPAGEYKMGSGGLGWIRRAAADGGAVGEGVPGDR